MALGFAKSSCPNEAGSCFQFTLGHLDVPLRKSEGSKPNNEAGGGGCLCSARLPAVHRPTVGTLSGHVPFDSLAVTKVPLGLAGTNQTSQQQTAEVTLLSGHAADVPGRAGDLTLGQQILTVSAHT